MSISTLVEFTTCEISDALIKLGSPHGGYIPDILMMSPPVPDLRICAKAYTVKMVAISDSSAPKLQDHFVDTAPSGCCIVIDAPSCLVVLLAQISQHALIDRADTKNAVWGGLMSAAAQAHSAAGVIISGRCRDLMELESLGFPVFARGHSTLGQSPFTRPSEINVPLVIRPQGESLTKDPFPPVTVVPGDWMIADRDGVVCVPKALEFQVIEVARKGREVDDLCMRDIKAGKGVQTTFKKHRE